MRFSLRKLFAATLVFSLLFAMALAAKRSIIGRSRVSRRIEAQLESMASAKPADFNAKQWQVMVDWTRNLHGNSLLAFQTSLSEITAFESRLNERLDGTVDASTIEWIWDKYDRVFDGGHQYQRFLLQVNAELAAHNSPVMLESPASEQHGG